MKKLTMIALMLGMSLMILSGCGGSPSSNTAPTPTAAPTATAAPSSTPTATPTAGSGTAVISSDQAKATALQHAGLAEASVWGLKVEQGTENGRNVYEVDFKYDGKDYDYDIDATTGEIVKYDVDIDD